MTQIEKNGDIQIAYTKENDTILIHGTATLWYETKILHGCKKVGHIEDVIVSPQYRDQGITMNLINILKVNSSATCHKVILHCSKEYIPFYEKCDFVKKEVQMEHFF